MPGLLDNFNMDPQTMGLLSAAAGFFDASGPSTTRRSLGQVLGHGFNTGMQGYQGARKSQFDLQKEQLQMDMLKQQVAQSTRKNELINNMIAGFGQQQTDAPGQSMQGNGMRMTQDGQVPNLGPTSQAAGNLQTAQRSNPLSFVPSNAIRADLAFNDGKELSKYMFETGKRDMQVHNGFAYDKNRIDSGFLPGMSTAANGTTSMTSIGPDGQPVVSAPAGAVDTFSAYQNAAKRAENENTLLPNTYITKDANGNFRPAGGTIADQIRAFQPQPSGMPPQQPAPQQPMPQRGNQIPPPVSMGGGGMPLPPGRPGMSAPPQMAQAGNRPTLQSQAEKQAIEDAQAIEKQRVIGKMGVGNAVDEAQLKNYPEYVKQKQAALASSEQMLSSIDRVMKHPGLSASTGLQGTLDPRNYVPGTDATDFKVALDQIKGGTFLQAYTTMKGAGAVTDIEGKKATDAIARLDRAQSTTEFKAAMVDLRDVIVKGMGRLDAMPDPVDLARNKISGTAQAQTAAPPRDAINLLRMNPKLRDAFDQKYGTGAAQNILGR